MHSDCAGRLRLLRRSQRPRNEAGLHVCKALEQAVLMAARGAAGRVLGRLICPDLVKVLNAERALDLGLELALDLSLLQLGPVNGFEESVLADGVGAARA